jgi:hypothetical protein
MPQGGIDGLPVTLKIVAPPRAGRGGAMPTAPSRSRRQALWAIRQDTPPRCTVDGVSVRLWNALKKPFVAQGGRYTPAQRCNPPDARRGGHRSGSPNGFAEEDLWRVLRTLAIQGGGRLMLGRPPSHGSAEWRRARAHVVFDEAHRTQRQFPRCLLGQNPVFWYAWQDGDPVRDAPIGVVTR